MASPSLRFWLAAAIFLLAVLILFFSLLPAVHIQQVIPMPPVVLPTATRVAGWTTCAQWLCGNG
jgi:hypothetical protein